MTAPTPSSGGRLVAITGSSGLIGAALSEALRGRGDRVLHLVRRGPRASTELPPGVREARWQPGSELDPAVLAGVTGAVNLAGAGLFEGRWTEKRKKELIGSRVGSTDTLSRALAGLVDGPADEPPRLVSGSAIGIYGDQGNTVLSEDSPQAEGFVADLVRDWEAATAPAEQAGVPVAHIRTGIVLSPRGGALGRLLPLARAGLGGPLGSGRQYWPWITLHDHVRAMLFLLDRPDVTGPVNLTGPHPDTQAKVVRALAAELHRPALLPAPTAAMKLVLGQAASEVLNSARVLPTRLTAAGFTFDHPDLRRAAAWVVDELRWHR
ncbi:TIGR01777 family oxidoreductase [Ornithinimicrobium flavum]|uniref:TIGR01777 family oxidoreductase n=1 Tax=Ornithinimicrobium flavum TaxID=1288636 RepID=UPI0010701DA5|nr:TIGR01777 family oxidoreductase [Ornithinimicrobium flavum]